MFNVDNTAFCWKKVIAGEHKSPPGFTTSQNSLTLFLGANPAGDFSQGSFIIPKILGFLRIMLNTLPVLYTRNDKAWVMAHLLTTWLTECFKPTDEKSTRNGSLNQAINIHPISMSRINSLIDSCHTLKESNLTITSLFCFVLFLPIVTSSDCCCCS